MAHMARFRGMRLWWPGASWRGAQLPVGLGTFVDDPSQSGEKGSGKDEGSGLHSPGQITAGNTLGFSRMKGSKKTSGKCKCFLPLHFPTPDCHSELQQLVITFYE